MRNFLLILAFFLYANIGLSQSFKFGLKFSPHVSWLKIDKKDSIKNDGVRVSFSYGLTSEFNFSDNYALNIEILHVFVNTAAVKKDNTSYVYKMQYVEVPICLKMKTNEIDDIRYYGQFGISPMVRTSARLNNNIANNRTKFLNFGMVIGAGVHYKLAGKTYALAGLSFHNNFGSVNKNSGDYKLKPVYVAVDLGILF